MEEIVCCKCGAEANYAEGGRWFCVNCWPDKWTPGHDGEEEELD